MEFIMGTQFSREFSHGDRFIIDDLTKTLNKCFVEKKYDQKTEKIYMDFICVSKGFEPFFMARPLKILKKEPAIEYEIKLEFETFFNSNTDERIKILNKEFHKQSKEILNNKKLKDFKLKEFLEDLQECLNI
jgi:hypothetical protein